MTAPRLLVIMGSGETAPTMVTPHRDIVARFGGAPPRAVLLDTPYGFQENAAEISQRAVDYFAQRVQLAIEVAGFPGPLAANPADRSTQPTAAALARLRTADLVFAGPGSPTYALSTWRGSSVPEALADKLAHGGITVFASAAARHRRALQPSRLRDLQGRAADPLARRPRSPEPARIRRALRGRPALGQRRGRHARHALLLHGRAHGSRRSRRCCPDDAWVLGVDEHTALVIDLDTGEAAVTGRGGVTVRRRGVLERFPAGTRMPVTAGGGGAWRARPGGAAAAPAGAAARSGSGSVGHRARSARRSSTRSPASSKRLPRPLPDGARTTRRRRSSRSTARSSSGRATRSRRTIPIVPARCCTRWCTVSASPPRSGLRDPKELLAPLVERLIVLRAELRTEKAFQLADRLRDRLVAAGSSSTTHRGTTWTLRD